MTKAQALQVRAAIELMLEMEKEHRTGSYTTGNTRAANDARMECAADVAKDALTDYLICGHVYGDVNTMASATEALYPERQTEPDGEPSDVQTYGAGVK